MTTEFAGILVDLAHVAQVREQQGREIAELLGLSHYLTTKLEKLAMADEQVKTKVDELTAKLKDFEGRVVAAEAAKDALIASGNATIAANQAIVDGLNAKIADLTAQIAAGTDTSAVLAEIQSDIDSIPLDPVVAPPAVPVPDPAAASTTGT